jgi:predicted transposase YbfD/YdcC
MTQPADIDAPVMAVLKSACAGSRTPAGYPSVIPRACTHSKRSPKGVSTRNEARKASRDWFFVAWIEPHPNAILLTVRSRWGIENHLHWTLNVIFDEDRCKT